MPVLFSIVLLVFAGVGLGLLLWPFLLLRHIQNPWQPDTPENRVQMRGIGLVFCLFLLMILSGSGSTAVLEGFHRNIVIALWASFLIVPIFLWLLWQFSPLQKVIRRHLTGERTKDPLWELSMGLAFSGLLSVMIFIAFLAALKGYYPRQWGK